MAPIHTAPKANQTLGGSSRWMYFKAIPLVLFLCGSLLFCNVVFATDGFLLPNGEQQFVDENGAPYADGLVYFYTPNTSTPKNTYSTQDLGSLNTNPVELDSAGRAVIFGTGAYRQVLIDEDGNTIWDKTVQAALVPTNNLSDVASVSTARNNLGLGSSSSPTFTSPLTVLGTSSAGASLLLGEDTDNGSNTAAVKAPDSIASNIVLTLPSSTGTLALSTQSTFPTPLTVTADATTPSSVVLQEDTDNGSNTATIIAPASIASNRIATLQDASGTVAYTADIPTNTNAVTAATYTPTLNNTTNITSSSASPMYYFRYGNFVIVFGPVTVDLAATGTLTLLGMSVPIASNFGQTYDAAGTCSNAVNGSGTGQSLAVIADTSNDRFSVTGPGTDGTTSIILSCLIAYKVI